MNYILLRRKPTLRIMPLKISVNDEAMVKFVTYWKEHAHKSMGISFRDAECPVSNAVGSMGLEHLKRMKKIY